MFSVSLLMFLHRAKEFRLDIRKKKPCLLVRIKILKEISGRSWGVADQRDLRAGLLTHCQMLV